MVPTAGTDQEAVEAPGSAARVDLIGGTSGSPLTHR